MASLNEECKANKKRAECGSNEKISESLVLEARPSSVDIC